MAKRSYWHRARDWAAFGSAVAMVLYVTLASHHPAQTQGPPALVEIAARFGPERMASAEIERIGP